MQARYDAIVIGAGHNGLVCANYLARAGLKTLVVERLPRVGGAISTEEVYPGFKAPFCPYTVYNFQGKIVQELELERHGLTFLNSDPQGFHPLPDGSHFLQWEDLRRTCESIRAVSPRDAEAYPEWDAFWERAGGILHRYFLQEPPTFAQVFADLRGTRDEGVWETMLTVPFRDLVDHYFEDPRVKAFASLGIIGMGDPSIPGSVFSAAYYQVAHLTPRTYRGIPKGGMSAMAEALASAARAQGVEIRLGTPVERILLDGGRVSGVRLESGEVVGARVVASCAEAKRTFFSLLGGEALPPDFARRVSQQRTRGRSVKFLAALKGLPDFSHYLGPSPNPRALFSIFILPSVEELQANCDAWRDGRLPPTPILEVQIPSILDPTLAPPGMHVLSAWATSYPYTLKEARWEEVREGVARQIIEALASYAPNFPDLLLGWALVTPEDIEARNGMTGGDIRHGEVSPRQMLSRRLPYRSPVEGLYLCGSSAHPGGELTGAPGHNCARVMLRDLGLRQ